VRNVVTTLEVKAKLFRERNGFNSLVVGVSLTVSKFI